VLARNWRLGVSERDDDRRRRDVAQSLGRHNSSKGYPDDWRPLSVFAHAPPRWPWSRGRLIGGLNGGSAWGWLYISHLWVEEGSRHLGLGSALMAEIESRAKARGMAGAHLTTASFQARGFYEKQGFSVFGELEGMPPGGVLYYMRKIF
jgi:ribosomal protein S18 acetylase RimI-like enzyme